MQRFISSTIKVKSVDVRLSTYFDFDKKNNKEDPEFKVGDPVKISNLKTCFQKFVFQICLKTVLWFQMLKILLHGHMLLVIFKMKKLLEPFMKENCKKQIKEFTREKVIKRKGDNSFNSWIDEKAIFM